ncbi:MAG TPA: hypothetical protein VF021_11255 [Longimicrobiales bacterium]
MKRHCVIALAALMVIPCLARAQSGADWGPRFRITPFVGISPVAHQDGIAFTSSAGVITRRPYRFELDSSLPLGVNAEYHVWNRFSIIGEGVWSSRSSATLEDVQAATIDTVTGTNLWMAKVAAALRLREDNPDMQLNRMNGSIFVGPAYIRDAPKVEFNTPALSQSAVSQFGLNMGADAELPLANNRLALQLGFEDYMIFWDEAGYSTRLQGFFQQGNPSIDGAAIDADNTNVWIARVGVTFRF